MNLKIAEFGNVNFRLFRCICETPCENAFLNFGEILFQKTKPEFGRRIFPNQQTMPRSRKFNWIGFVSVIGYALGTSLMFSLEDNTLTNMEIFRGLVSCSVAAFAFLQARYIEVIPPTIQPPKERNGNDDEQTKR